MALSFTIGATKKSKSKKEAKKPARKRNYEPGDKRYPVSTKAGKILAGKTQGYRSAGADAKRPSAAVRKAAQILAICKHYGTFQCNNPESVQTVLKRSKSTWKPVGTRKISGAGQFNFRRKK